MVWLLEIKGKDLQGRFIWKKICYEFHPFQEGKRYLSLISNLVKGFSEGPFRKLGT